MKIKNCFRLSLLTALLLAAPAGYGASLITETFSNDNNTEGWFEVTDAAVASLSQNPSSDVLDFSASGFGLFYVVGDVSSSGGAFAGDYAGITTLKFDLLVNSGSSISGLVLEFASISEDETWQYPLPIPAAGVLTSYEVPIGEGVAGWVQSTGGESFGFLLSQVEEVAIGLTGDGTGSVSGSLDNIALVPEPSSAVLALGFLGAGVLARRRR